MRAIFMLGGVFWVGCAGELQSEAVPPNGQDGGQDGWDWLREGGGSAAPDIHLTPSSIDFGTPVAGSDVVRQITISNVGQGVLVIGRATASDADTTAEFHVDPPPPSGWLIGAGQVQMVEVVLRSRDCLADSGEICFESNDPDEAQACATLSALAATAAPQAVEVCNGADDDCDGSVDEDAMTSVELCNGRDDDCNEFPDEGCDDDGDGACDRAMDPSCGDCNDADANVGPAAIETCNGMDEDCDGMIDEGGNGCGGACRIEATIGAPCDGPDGDSCTDDTVICDGANATTCSTGDSIAEICNMRDDDCDGAVDEGDNGCGGVCPLARPPGTACEGPDGDTCSDDVVVCTSPNTTTCGTGDTNVELCDAIDNDCDGRVNEGFECSAGDTSATGCNTCQTRTCTGGCEYTSQCGGCTCSGYSACIAGAPCAPGFHPTAFGCSYSCGVCSGLSLNNHATCEPNCGSSFTMCGNTCPRGYHPTAFGCSNQCLAQMGTLCFGSNNNVTCTMD